MAGMQEDQWNYLTASFLATRRTRFKFFDPLFEKFGILCSILSSLFAKKFQLISSLRTQLVIFGQVKISIVGSAWGLTGCDAGFCVGAGSVVVPSIFLSAMADFSEVGS